MIYKLSKNFNSNELRVSKSHPELANLIDLKLDHILAAQILSITCLQSIRDRWGRLDVLSWVRDQALNNAVNGASNSDHLLGCAADITSINFGIEDIFKWCVLQSNIPYRQIIWYPANNFIHVSCNHPENSEKHEALVKVGDDYVKFKEYYCG